MPALGDAQVRDFVKDGFVRIERAFPRALADEARAILWRDTGCAPDDPVTWTRPVIRLGDYAQAPFRAAVNTPVLHDAFDRLVGPGGWVPRGSLGSFPVRFPSADAPGDTGWHVDASFPGAGAAAGDYLGWRVNVSSKGRALLMLFLFSDVAEDDAPTRIRVGSHLDVAARLAPFGADGVAVRDLDTTSDRPVAVATGEAGTVFLCHPFLLHAAQPHRGRRPRFMAQPPLLPARPLRLFGPVDSLSPVAAAIRRGLDERGQAQQTQ